MITFISLFCNTFYLINFHFMYKNQPFYYYFFNCYTSKIKDKIRAHKYYVTMYEHVQFSSHLLFTKTSLWNGQKKYKTLLTYLDRHATEYALRFTLYWCSGYSVIHRLNGPHIRFELDILPWALITINISKHQYHDTRIMSLSTV